MPHIKKETEFYKYGAVNRAVNAFCLCFIRITVKATNVIQKHTLPVLCTNTVFHLYSIWLQTSMSASFHMLTVSFTPDTRYPWHISTMEASIRSIQTDYDHPSGHHCPELLIGQQADKFSKLFTNLTVIRMKTVFKQSRALNQ